MGQEIVYCFWCSTRILGADLERGAAVLIGNRACCSKCLHQVLASLPEAERATVLAQMNRTSTGPAARPAPRLTPRGGTPLPPPAPAASSTRLLAIIGGGIAVLAVIVIAVASGSRAPEPPRPPAPATAAPPPRDERSDREKAADRAIARARDAGNVDIDTQVRLWDDAVQAADRTSRLDAASRERAAILEKRKEAYAQEIKQLADSIDGMVRTEEFKRALDLLASARKRHDSPDWTMPLDRKAEEVKKSETAAAAFRQSEDADGLVVIEAEHFTAKQPRGNHEWTLVTAPAGFTGEGAMAALPNADLAVLKDWGTLCPRMDYKVKFTKTGKHYVWVRALADTDRDNSVHLGLDGNETKSMSHMGYAASKKWTWTSKSMDGAAAWFAIDVPGIHVLNVFMREDGAIVDRVVVTTNPKWSPKDPGPPESPR